MRRHSIERYAQALCHLRPVCFTNIKGRWPYAPLYLETEFHGYSVAVLVAQFLGIRWQFVDDNLGHERSDYRAFLLEGKLALAHALT
jgi:hypothetical protein